MVRYVWQNRLEEAQERADARIRNGDDEVAEEDDTRPKLHSSQVPAMELVLQLLSYLGKEPPSLLLLVVSDRDANLGVNPSELDAKMFGEPSALASFRRMLEIVRRLLALSIAKAN